MRIPLPLWVVRRQVLLHLLAVWLRILDALAEQDMERHYYRSHKASFNTQAFPPGEVTAKNTKFKPKIQIDCIRNVVHTWHDYADRTKDQALSEREEKAFNLFKQANKAGNKWINQYKTFELNLNGTMKVILCRMESKKDENGEEKLELGREVISQEEVFDAINDIHRSTVTWAWSAPTPTMLTSIYLSHNSWFAFVVEHAIFVLRQIQLLLLIVEQRSLATQITDVTVSSGPCGLQEDSPSQHLWAGPVMAHVSEGPQHWIHCSLLIAQEENNLWYV
jgi:hypothetical protein